jgi:hypothetical protein
VGLKSDKIAITLAFGKPVRDLRDERTGQALGSGSQFKFDWKMNGAVVVSFAGPPPR